MQFLKIAVLMCVFLVTACHHALTFEDLLEHPHKINSLLKSCQEHNDYSPYCKMVRRASDNYIALVEVRHANPEQFGMQILRAEQELVKKQEAHEDFSAELHKVKVLLAVVSDDRDAPAIYSTPDKVAPPE